MKSAAEPMLQDDRSHIRIHFRLEQDEDGYPPAGVETLWAVPQGNGRFRVDNTPFFVREISDGDIVSATQIDGEWWFDAVVEPSGHSTLRIILFELEQVEPVTGQLMELGCSYEGSHIPNLVAIDVPPDASIVLIFQYLEELRQQSILEYQESCRRYWF